MSDAPTRAAELVARTSYGRLVALLAVKSRDIAAAEDALAEAFVAALARWPRDGIPQNPDGWLLAAARRRLIDGHRRSVVRTREADAVRGLIEELAEHAPASGAMPDDRLRLIPSARTPRSRPRRRSR